MRIIGLPLFTVESFKTKSPFIKILIHPTFICLKSTTTETLQKGVKYVQSEQ